MNFKTFLSRQEKTRSKKISLLFRRLSRNGLVWSRLVSNLQIENRLSSSAWDEMIAGMLMPRLRSFQIQAAIRDFCRKHILIGRTARVPRDAIFGRAVSFQRFCLMLVKLRYYSSLPAAMADVRRIVLSGNLRALGRRWSTHKLGMYLMWSTFEHNGDRPFADPRIPAADLVCSLGLEPIVGPVLVLEYKLPPYVTPMIPTICDAYSATTWNPYFLRAKPFTHCGSTLPAPNRKGVVGRPEVVHSVIDAQNLHTPPRYA